MNFKNFNALSFDCYGTLIDWETGILNALQPWAAWRGISASPDQLLTSFSTHENVVEGESPAMLYPDVLAHSLRRIAADYGTDASDRECDEFGASVGAWPAFADTALALRRLKARFTLIIVSNVDRTSFAGSNRRLGVEFDLIVTAEDVHAYKPRLEHFTAMFDQLPSLGVTQPHLLHVAQSLFHDHGPAQQLGLPSVWIDRREGKAGTGATPPVDVHVPDRFGSLQAFADAALGSAT
jgi:2-haloacid dehalogenase